jgi:hypothetical protein
VLVLDAQAEATQALGCLRFTLDFQSLIGDKGTGQYTIFESVQASVIMETTSWTPKVETAGIGSIVSTAGSIHGLPSQCHASYLPNASSFTSRIKWPNFTKVRHAMLKAIGIEYTIAVVPSTITLTCSGPVPPEQFKAWWWNDYVRVHGLDVQPDGSYRFFTVFDEVTYSQSPWATAHRDTPPGFPGLTENTDIKVNHTPK